MLLPFPHSEIFATHTDNFCCYLYSFSRSSNSLFNFWSRPEWCYMSPELDYEFLPMVYNTHASEDSQQYLGSQILSSI